MAAPDLLLRLLETPGPSGAEDAAAAVWREAAAAFAEVSTDASGNSFARVRGTGGGPLVALFGHVDEIGLIVTHVDDDGFLYFRGVGGWNPQVLLAQRVELLTRDGRVRGVIAARRDPARVEEKRRVELKDLHIDIGARSRDEAAALVRLGDTAVVTAAPLELPNRRLASRALDNRLGAYVVLEAARRVADAGGAPGDVVAIATVQEEVGDFLGARTSTFALEPAFALAVDVTTAVDVPGGDPKEQGEQKLGAGPSIVRGPGMDTQVFELLRDAAEAEGIPYAVEVSQGRSMTDADAVYVARGGVRTGLLSIPTRYLHTPVELVGLDDVEATIRLVAAFAQRVASL